MSCALQGSPYLITRTQGLKPALQFELAERSDSSDFFCGRFPRECQGDSLWLLYSCILLSLILNLEVYWTCPWMFHPIEATRSCLCVSHAGRQRSDRSKAAWNSNWCDQSVKWILYFCCMLEFKAKSHVALVAAWCPRVASLAAFLYWYFSWLWLLAKRNRG